jgi:cholest-4-en-3-one 26-monooxygenase
MSPARRRIGSPGRLRLDDPALYSSGMPHALYAELRAAGGLAYSDGPLPFHAVLRHADALTVLQDAATFSSARHGILIEDTPDELVPVMRAMLPFLDSPDHGALRRKLAPGLLPEQIAAFRPALEIACADLVRRALERRDIEAVRELAAEVPLLAFGVLMGLEREEIEPLRQPADAIVERGINRSPDAVAALCRHLDALIEGRRRARRDDYLTRLATVELEPGPMTPIERTGMLMQIAIGGLETTRSAIAGFLAELLDHPGEWRRLRDEPDLIANACEESLRAVSPVNYLRRTTTRPVRLAECDLPDESRIVVFLGAANRDPARFTDPGVLDVGRSNARQHVALGAGPHFCMGAWYARMQLTTFWSAFAREVRGFAPRSAVVRRPTVQHNLVVALPLRLEGRAG